MSKTEDGWGTGGRDLGAISSKGSDLQETRGGWADSKACALSQAADGGCGSCSDASETATGVAGRKKS